MSHSLQSRLQRAPLLLRRLTGTPAEMAALQALLEAAPRYFETVRGMPPEGQGA